PGQRGHQQAALHVRDERRAWHLGLVYQLDVVAAAARQYLQLLLPLEQRLVDLPVALRFAFQDRVADVLAAQRHRRALLVFERALERAFFGERRLVVVVDGFERLADLGVELT